MTTLEQKLDVVKTWNRAEALQCWETYHNKYLAKHGGALHCALMKGDGGAYIDLECRTFARYARMWQYQKWKQTPQFCIVEAYATPPIDAIRTDLHHIAQENKLRRYHQGGCHL